MSSAPREKRDLPEIWAGVECTLNRVGDRYVDQCLKNGHTDRFSDLERFSELGISRIRYPFLWEKAASNSLDSYEWGLFDRQVAELRRVGLRPIAGLLHHGSGPRETSLVDPFFPEKFTRYARAFAERYPELDAYTPINEPLTTARFSGLYGIWYPHGRDDRSFSRALYNQVRATSLAMREIRRIRPDAKLIQTEDFGRASGTRRLAYQVDFENKRRWLSFDLLSGRVTKKHFFWKYLRKHGISEEELQILVDEPTTPDIFGINHYLLSNRFLDHRVHLYPSELRGGNHRHRYADVGAVDTGAAEPPTPASLIEEVWERYRLPVAITEAHVSGPREAQLQWLFEIWKSASSLRKRGLPIVGVTAWSLLGSFDWNTLCTNPEDCAESFYESGVFDVRSPQPRPTALARMVAALAKHESFSHPVLEQKGWWHHPERARFLPEFLIRGPKRPRSRPLLITGAESALGKAFARVCSRRGLAYELVGSDRIEHSNEALVRMCLESVKPWAVVNAAGYSRVDAAENDPKRCFLENAWGPEVLAREAERMQIPILSFSTDLVFDGERDEPYQESHEVAPLNVFGRSKLEGEKRVLGENRRGLVLRTSAFFSPWDAQHFVAGVLRALLHGGEVDAPMDLVFSPTYMPDLVHVALDLLIDGEIGLNHVTNQGMLTWHELAHSALGIAERGKHLERFAIRSSEKNAGKVRALPASAMGFRALRPKNSAMTSERHSLLPSLESALERYFRELHLPLLKPLCLKVN